MTTSAPRDGDPLPPAANGVFAGALIVLGMRWFHTGWDRWYLVAPALLLIFLAGGTLPPRLQMPGATWERFRALPGPVRFVVFVAVVAAGFFGGFLVALALIALLGL